MFSGSDRVMDTTKVEVAKKELQINGKGKFVEFFAD